MNNYLTIISNKNELINRIKALRIGNELNTRETEVLAISSLSHFFDHGNSTPLSDLVQAMGRGQRKNSLIKWACDFGGLSYIKERKATKTKPAQNAKFKKAMKFDTLQQEIKLELAIETPYHQLKNVVEGKVWNQEDYKSKVLAYIVKAKAELEKHGETLDLNELLKQVA